MKRIIQLALIFICLSAPAFAQTVTHRVATASTTNAATYASGSFTPAASDLLVAFVVVTGQAAGGGTMTDSQSLGWDLIATALKNTSADQVYCFVARALAANSSMTVTFATNNGNATGAIVDVDSVSSMLRTGSLAVRQSATQANQAASGTPAPTFGSAVLTGNPTLGAVGNGTNPATLTAPASWTENADTGYATPTTGGEFISRNSGFTGTTVTWGSTSASAFGDIIIELDISSVPAAPAVPVLVQHQACPNSGTLGAGTGSTTHYTCQLNDNSLSGNTLVASFFMDDTATPTATFSDDQSNTYTLAAIMNPDSHGNKTAIYVAKNIAASTRKVTLTIGTGMFGFIGVNLAEFSNVDQTTPIDAAVCTGTDTTTSMPAGSISPVFLGDALYQVAWASDASVATGFTVGSQGSITWALTSTMRQDGSASQWGVFSASGTKINPTFTTSPSHNVDSCAVALKPASAGAVPSSTIARILKMQHEELPTSGANPWVMQFPSDGTTGIVISFNGGGNTLSSVTSSPSNTWTCPSGPTNSTHVQFCYTSGAFTASNSMTISVTRSATTTDGTFLLNGVVNYGGFDLESAGETGNQTSQVSSLTMCSSCITPTTSNGVVFFSGGQDFCTATSQTAPTNALFDAATYDGNSINGPQPVDQNNMLGHFYNSNTSALSSTWGESCTQAEGLWAHQAAAFKVLTTGGPPANQFPRIVGAR